MQAQNKKIDTLDLLNQVKIKTKLPFVNNIFQDALNSVRRSTTNTETDSLILVERSDDRYKNAEGKIIRYILVQRYGFEQPFTDTTNRIAYFGTRLLNSLHVKTKEFVIRQNLFMTENTPVNAYELADNERYLRTLEFIQDARIFTASVGHDSVDIIVITKDLFSLTGTVDISGLNRAKATGAEANLGGTAQKVQSSILWDKSRSPQMAYEALYSKNNIGGSFINGSVMYSQIDGARVEDIESENVFTIRFERPLVTPFSHIAGAASFSHFISKNVYNQPDSTFYRYNYDYYDGWMGYNIGTHFESEHANYTQNRRRIFIAARYYKADFRSVPMQIGNHFDPVYNPNQAAIGEITLFEQNFYKLNYIYGFGTTEDVPTGYNISISAGWHKQWSLERPYGGIQFVRFIVSTKGAFAEIFGRVGGFFHQNQVEDASLMGGINYFTRLVSYERLRARGYVRFSYSQLQNRITSEPLRINNAYGISDYSTDSIVGNRRLSLYGEGIVYTQRKLLGFRFAPFIFFDGVMIPHDGDSFSTSETITGIGGGVRTRNENLIFGTMELRMVYFPRTVQNISPFQIMFSSDLRYRYKTNFVHAPDIIYLNRSFP